MESLVIHSVSRKSADGFCTALSAAGFRPKLVVAADGHCEVEVVLGGNDAEIVDALNALEAHVSARADDPVRLS